MNEPTRAELGKARRALKKLGELNPSEVRLKEIVSHLHTQGIDLIVHSSRYLANFLRKGFQKEINGEKNSGWSPQDSFGTRAAGEEAAYEATPNGWRELYYTEADRLKALGEIVTSQTVVAQIGRPPGHPSRIAAVHGGWVKSRGLKPLGVEKSNDRHQGHHHTW